MADHLITQTGPLLDAEGRLREPGYALRPPFSYDSAQVTAPSWRIKDWDYYLMEDGSCALALTFSDLGYLGLVSASVIDLGAPSYKTTSQVVPLPLGNMGLPASSDEGDIIWADARCSVVFRHVPGGRRLSFAMRDFDENGMDLEAELLLTDEPRDSIVTATPWAEDPRAFYYNRKVLGMAAQGGFRWGAHVHEFDPAEALGLLDWGRGVWTYDNVWWWAAAQGHQDGHVLGLNLGYGFGDTSAASENVLFVDGVAHKLGRVKFSVPLKPGAGFDYMGPWRMRDNERRLDVTFSPTIDRRDHTDVAGLLVTDQHQVFGTFSGTVTLDDGSTLELRALPGAAERVHNRY